MIDRATIDRIFAAADIAEVIGDFVKLKRTGSNYKGLSPFTNEKTPSFFVSPSKGIYKCFSSGKGGNVVTFVMEREKLSYPEALKYLAKKYGIEVAEKEESPEELKQKDDRESMLAVNQYALGKFAEYLRKTDEGQAIGLSYFYERGFRDDIIEKFQLGYSPEKRDAFTRDAQTAGYQLDYLTKTGLSIQKDEYCFDRFHGRVMFPIHSLSGQVLGFGGRIMKTSDKAAKYLNSPESEIYHKSNILYGIFFARQAITKEDKCYLVEGYTDVISMHQSDISNVVASSGTALTVEQIRLIKRFTKNITVLYDGDEAGIKASLRGIDMILEEGLNVKVVLMPDGEDPDSFARSRSATEFLGFVSNSETDFISFKTRLLIKDAQSDPVKRATLITDIVRSISVIPEGITRTVYIRECGRMLEIDEQVLYAEIGRIRRSAAEKKHEQHLRPTLPEEGIPVAVGMQLTNKEPWQAEKDLIRLLINYGNREVMKLVDEGGNETIVSVARYVMSEVESDELTFNTLVYRFMYQEICRHINEQGLMDVNFFIFHEDKNIANTAVDLLASTYQISKIWAKHDNFVETEDMKIHETVPEAINALKNQQVLSLIRDTQKLLKNAEQNHDDKAIAQMQHRYIILNQLKKELAKNLGVPKLL